MAKVSDKETDDKIHHGRREKLRTTFQRYGLETFNETQVIEFALGMVVPRTDTNPTAHRLMDTFGSLNNVISATPDKLEKVPGVGPLASCFLHFLKQFTTYINGVERQSEKINSPTDAIKILKELMKTYAIEHFIVVCLDKAGSVMLHQSIPGDIDKVDINLRSVVDVALRVQCASVVFAHNHLGDNVHPSGADVHITRGLLGVLLPLNVKIIDHIIFGKDDYYSFFQSGVLDILKREHYDFANARTTQV